jgi:hypothetical protein
MNKAFSENGLFGIVQFGHRVCRGSYIKGTIHPSIVPQLERNIEA